jgi:hypothetical protein
MDITASPGLPEPDEIHTLVVYDPKTGVIVHRHHVVTYPGAPRSTKEQLEARAIELARARAGTKKSLAVLHADWQAFTEPIAYRVDPKKRQLVRGRKSSFAVPLPSRRAKRTK